MAATPIVTNDRAKSENGTSTNNGSRVNGKPNGQHQNGKGTGPEKSTRTASKRSGSSTGRKLAECLLGLSLPLWSTISFQANEPSCRTSWLIASTTATYGILYALLRHFDGFLQPALSSWQVAKNDNAQNGDSMSAAKASAAEWRSRLLCIGNALILIVGSGLCFGEWVSTYVPDSEGWVKTLPLVCDENDKGDVSSCSCFVSHPITFASLFVGYLQWDLCWLIWHRETHPDVGSMIHHSIFIGVTQFVLSGTYFRKPFAWLSLTELSTPFLHVRWILAATGRKAETMYFGASLGFALTFLSTRTVGYGLGLFDVWRNQESWGVISGLWWVVAGLHLAYLLNLFWSFKVASALVRALTSKNKVQKPQKHKPE